LWVTRYYYNNNSTSLAETDYDSSGPTETQLRDYIYGNYIDEVLIMTDDSDAEHYYGHDHIFSVVALIEDDGDVEERYEYDAYGKPEISNADFTQTYDASQFGNPYMFTSRRVDSLDSDDLQLQYNRNRYYDYHTGRWLSHDPLGVTPNGYLANSTLEPKKQYRYGTNLYEYVKSIPSILIDPFGLWHYKQSDKAKRSKERTTIALPDSYNLRQTEEDRKRDLALFMGLNYSDFSKWATKTECGGYKVPNTAYIDADTFSYGPLGYVLINEKNQLKKAWLEQGLFVEYNGPFKTTKATVEKHLKARDIYKFALFAHGDADALNGSIQFNDDIFPLRPGQHTNHKINEMMLFVCWSNRGESGWRHNIAQSGGLLTFKNKITLFSDGHPVWTSGYPDKH